MATTVTAATLNVYIQEEITLNGQEQGAKIQHTIPLIKQVDERVLTISYAPSQRSNSQLFCGCWNLCNPKFQIRSLEQS